MLCYLRMDISFEVRANAISLIANIIIFFSKTYPSFLTVKEGVFLKSSRPSLPLKKEFFLPLRLSCKESSTFLTKPLFPQGREDVTALRCSEPLRSKVGGPSKVFAMIVRDGTALLRCIPYLALSLI